MNIKSENLDGIRNGINVLNICYGALNTCYSWDTKLSMKFLAVISNRETWQVSKPTASIHKVKNKLVVL